MEKFNIYFFPHRAFSRNFHSLPFFFYGIEEIDKESNSSKRGPNFLKVLKTRPKINLLSTFEKRPCVLLLEEDFSNYGHDDFSIGLLRDTTPHIECYDVIVGQSILFCGRSR